MDVKISPSAARSVPKEPVPAPKKNKMPLPPKMPEGPKFRIMPMTMTMLGLLLVLKTNDIYFSVQDLRSELVASAHAEDKKEDAKPADAPKEADAKPEEAAKEEAKPEEAAKSEDHGDKKEGDGDGHGEKKEGDKKPEAPPKISPSEIKTLKKLEEQTKYNQIELDLLNNLAKRRDELDAREKEMDLKAKVLEATEQRINGRIDEMKGLQGEVKTLIETYKSEQDADVRSLVKIYENMKPTAAAAIFNELDMPILLSVIDKMSERKVSPVLAAMSPLKAKEVTEELAELRKNKPVPTDPTTAGAPPKP